MTHNKIAKIILLLSASMIFINSYAEKPAVVAWVKSAKVIRKPVSRSSEFYGVVAAKANAIEQVSLQNPALIVDMAVRQGQSVQPGQTLMTLLPTEADSIRLKIAQINVNYARDNYRYYQKIHRLNLLKNAQITLENARRQIAKDQLILQELEQHHLLQTKQVITAKTNGVVLNINYQRGQIVPANATVLSIAGQQQLQVKFSIPLKTLKEFNVGQLASIKPIFSGEKTESARINFISQVVNPAAQSIIANAQLQPHSHFLVGMHVIVQVYLIHNKPMLVIPYSAVLYDGSKPYVYLDNNGKAKRQWVKLGFAKNNLYTVVSGLRVGQQVIYVGNYELQPGMAVRIRPA